MANQTRKEKLLNIKQGLLTFILAYIVITILAFGLYLLIATIMGVSLSATFNIREDRAYALAEQLYPILNLGVWIAFAWMYFRKVARPTIKQAWALGGFWLAIAVPLDLVYFVLIPNPLQVSAQGFYIDQFPWIYLTYIVVLVAPVVYLLTRQRLDK
jgi:hypothetical protein